MRVILCLCFCFLCDRQRKKAWPIILSLGNHVGSARNSMAGKRVIGMIEVITEHPEDLLPANAALFQFVSRTVYQEIWRMVLRLINRWKHGFPFILDGTSQIVHLVPRIGVVIADTKELWGLAATHSYYAVRCGVLVRLPTRGVASSGDVTASCAAATSTGTVSESEEQSDGSVPEEEIGPSVTANTVTSGVFGSAWTEGVDDDEDEDVDWSATMAPDCGSSDEEYDDDVSLETEILSTPGVIRDVGIGPAGVENEIINTGLAKCDDRFRDPRVREKLLADHVVPGGLPHSFKPAAQLPFKTAGLQPFVCAVFNLPEFADIMANLPLEQRIPADHFHVVWAYFPRGILVCLYLSCMIMIGSVCCI